jgi:drug/metabolite transporter superfamily protein YnfA
MAPDSTRGRRYAALGGATLAAGALTYIGLADPHRPGSLFPPCPFRLLTGWYCPGCGGLRMTHDVLHVDFPAAVADNVFLLFGLPLLAAWWLWRRSRRRPAFTVPVIIVISVAAVVWTVVRNMPGFPLVPTMLGS